MTDHPTGPLDSEIQVPEVVVPLDRSAAEKLDGRIRRLAKQAGDQLVQVRRLLAEAKAGCIHEALGFASWPAYIVDAVGGQLQLSLDERKSLVALMSGAGMSERAIADAVGVSQPTVHRDIVAARPAEVIHDESPAPDTPPSVTDLDGEGRPPAPEPAVVTGVDNKTYPKRRPQPEQKPPVSQRKSRGKTITDRAHTAGWDLSNQIDKLERIAAEDRFEAQIESVSPLLRGHLVFAINACQAILDRLTAPTPLHPPVLPCIPVSAQ